MSGDDKPRKRTVAEIEADLAASRERLTQTVDDLSRRVDPRAQVADMTSRAKGTATTFISDLKAGNPKALGVAGAAAAAVLAAVGLSISRRKK